MVAPADGRFRGLAALLRFQSVEHSFSKNLVIDAAHDALAAEPECLRMWDALCEEGGVSTQHEATAGGLQVFGETLSRQLGEVPGLPARVAALLPADDEVGEARALIDAGAPGVDQGEPSWAVLGHMIREARFVLAWRRLRFMRDIWSVPVDEFLAEARPMVADHPYRKFIESYGLDPRSQRPAIAAMIKDITPRDAERTQYVMTYDIGQVNPVAGHRHHFFTKEHVDFIARDLALMVGNPDNLGWGPHARKLLALSPYSPAAMSCLVREDWPFAKARVAEWRKSTGDHPQLLGGLAKHHDGLGEQDEAVRCLEGYVRAAPDRWAYEKLAAIHLRRKDLDKWKGTLDEFLTKPDFGLDHDQVQVAIAARLMAEKRWEDALPYALAAAETWAADGIGSLVVCYEGLKDWDNANLWLSRLVERYPSFYWQEWYFWCKRTGHGDPKAAALAATAAIEAMGDRGTVDDLTKAAYFFMGDGEARKAMGLFRKLLDLTGEASYGLPLAVLAEEQGDAAARDLAFDRCAKQKGAAPHFLELLTILREWLGKAKGAKLDLVALDANLAKFSPPGRANMSFFVGRLLVSRGQVEESARYLKACIQNRQVPGLTRIVAIGMLRDQGVEAQLPEKAEDTPP